MNINDLTIGEAKELAALFGGASVSSELKPSITQNAIGKYVIIRTRNEGINCGKLIQADETGCVLEDARRIYYHKPKDRTVCWYEGVALSGLSDDSKISPSISEKYIIEDYSITICSKLAEVNLRGYEATKQN